MKGIKIMLIGIAITVSGAGAITKAMLGSGAIMILLLGLSVCVAGYYTQDE